MSQYKSMFCEQSIDADEIDTDTANINNANITNANITNANIINIAITTFGQGVLHSSSAGLLSSSTIVNNDVSASAGIVYSKLNLSGSIINTDINSTAGIQYSKLALSGSILNTDINSTAGIIYSKLNLSGGILNNDINSAAGIQYSKLALSGSILNNDINSTAGIQYSKLALSGSILNNDINSAAGIQYSKLNLSGGVVNNDINSSAAISNSKLAGNPQSTNTVSTIVLRDASGSFIANIINATLSGTATNANNVQTIAGSGNYYMTGLANVSGYQQPSSIGNITANTSSGIITANNAILKNLNTVGIVHNTSGGVLSSALVSLTADVAGVLPNSNTTATSSNTVSTIVARDVSGSFSANIINATLSGTATNANNVQTSSTTSGNYYMTGLANLSGYQTPASISGITINTTNNTITAANATLTNLNLQGVVHNTSGGVLSSALVSLTADVAGVLPNANTTATSSNTVSTIVVRDASGSFSANVVNATLSGNIYTNNGSTGVVYLTSVNSGTNDAHTINTSYLTYDTNSLMLNNAMIDLVNVHSEYNGAWSIALLDSTGGGSYTHAAPTLAYNITNNQLVSNLSGVATTSSTIQSTGTSTSGVNYPVFQSSTAGAAAALNYDASGTYTYNPATGVLSASGFNGSIFCGIAGASSTYDLVLASNNGYQSLKVAGATYNNSTGTLTAANFNGNISVPSTTSGTYWLAGHPTLSGYQLPYSVSGITINAATSSITAPNFIGTLSGAASSVNSIATSSGTYYLAALVNLSGNQAPYSLSGITVNAATNVINGTITNSNNVQSAATSSGTYYLASHVNLSGYQAPYSLSGITVNAATNVINGTTTNSNNVNTLSTFSGTYYLAAHVNLSGYQEPYSLSGISVYGTVIYGSISGTILGVSTTQSANDNSTKIATTAYIDRIVGNMNANVSYATSTTSGQASSNGISSSVLWNNSTAPYFSNGTTGLSYNTTSGIFTNVAGAAITYKVDYSIPIINGGSVSTLLKSWLYTSGAGSSPAICAPCLAAYTNGYYGTLNGSAIITLGISGTAFVQWQPYNATGTVANLYGGSQYFGQINFVRITP